MCCDSYLHLQSNLPRRSVWLKDFNKFLFLKNVGHCFKILQVIKALFFAGKPFKFLGLYVIVKGIISSLLLVFVCLKTSTGISLAFNKLYSISDLRYFYSSNVFLSFFNHFLFIFSFSIVIHILLARENGIFAKQCCECFDVNGTYCFEYVGLL